MTDSPHDRAARLLAAARRGTEPSAADEARVRSRLHARVLAAPLLLSAKSAHAFASLGKLSLGKIVLALGVCGGSAVIASAAWHARSTAQAAAPSQPNGVSSSAASARGGSSPNVSRPVPDAPSQDAARVANADDSSSPSSSVVVSAPPKRAPSLASATPSAPSAEDLSTEIAGLRRAQQLLHGGNAGAALATLDQVARAVPKGALTEERDATRAIALCTLGRTSDPSVAAFFVRYPGSVHAARVRNACSHASFE